ncbi:MAG: helix-turn-helix transcriptional regulator [Lachnospiraceae bacterium]|nr:helix-turn-helix transcriptional regulator [Lachnospiraceae bacterium]MBQ8947977.1 helix-turn-helix transcriptional regulator [Lachnospiraceae bacterium]
MKKIFDRKIASERIRIGIGDDDAHTVAEKTGISEAEVKRILNGTDEMAYSEPLIAIARTYGVSMDWILGLTDEMRR